MSPPPEALLSGEAAAEVIPAAVAAPAPAAVATTSPQTLVKPKERYVYLDAMKGVMIRRGRLEPTDKSFRNRARKGVNQELPRR